MLEVICKCGRKNYSGEEHIGKMLKCGGCGLPVPIGTVVNKQAPVRWSEIDGEVSAKAQTRKIRRKLHLQPGHWIAVAVALCVLVVICVQLFTPSDPVDVALQPDKRSDSNNQGTDAQWQPVAPDVPLAVGSPNALPVSPRLATHSQSPIKERDECSIDPSASRNSTGDQLVSPTYESGRGSIILKNGTNYDAVVVLVSEKSGAIARSIFIRTKQSATLAHISPGNYLVKAATGMRWDDESHSFRQCASYFEFPETESFSETVMSGEVEYQEVTLTLHVVPNGNVRKVPITQEAFWPTS